MSRELCPYCRHSVHSAWLCDAVVPPHGGRCECAAEGLPTVQHTEDSKNETVNHPSHYGGDTVYEHIKVANAWGLNYELGNATKYIARAGKKNEATRIEDLKKARWYLDYEIQKLERE